MAEVKKLFWEMINTLKKEKRNLNRFHLTASHTITELYKTESYIEQLKATIKKLNNLMVIHENLKKTTPLTLEIGKTKGYARLINQIAVEFNYLIATNQAMKTLKRLHP